MRVGQVAEQRRRLAAVVAPPDDAAAVAGRLWDECRIGPRPDQRCLPRGDAAGRSLLVWLAVCTISARQPGVRHAGSGLADRMRQRGLDMPPGDPERRRVPACHSRAVGASCLAGGKGLGASPGGADAVVVGGHQWAADLPRPDRGAGPVAPARLGSVRGCGAMFRRSYWTERRERMARSSGSRSGARSHCRSRCRCSRRR